MPGFLPPTISTLDEDAIDGVSGFFDTTDGSRQLGETIVLLPDAEAARTAMQGAARTTQEQRPGASSAPAAVGDAGVIITGYEFEGTASTLLLFSQGVASVAMDFRSAAGDPTSADDVVKAGVQQAALLKEQYG